MKKKRWGDVESGESEIMSTSRISNTAKPEKPGKIKTKSYIIKKITTSKENIYNTSQIC